MSGDGIQYAFTIEGDNPARFVEELTPAMRKAMVMAINRTAQHARTDASRRIREQVAFPASYLSPGQGRLTLARKASVQSPEAIIRGRGRATSLARFIVGRKPQPGQGQKDGKLTVEVKPGHRAAIGRAFLIRLRSGGEGLGNLGFAVRTPGGPPPGAWKPKEIGKNLWLLYGPSVDQVLFGEHNGSGVIEEMSPATVDYLNYEFNRIMDAGLTQNGN